MASTSWDIVWEPRYLPSGAHVPGQFLRINGRWFGHTYKGPLGWGADTDRGDSLAPSNAPDAEAYAIKWLKDMARKAAAIGELAPRTGVEYANQAR